MSEQRARRDSNRVTTLIGVDSIAFTDSTTVGVNATTHEMLVVASFSGTGTATVAGNLTNNNAAPAATELGVLPALANASDPSWTEGRQVLNSVNLTGYQRTVLQAETTKVIGTVNATVITTTSAGGSASSSGNNTLVSAGTNSLKVHAFTLSTTSTTSVTCIFQSGAGGTELWRVVLQAPTNISTGANLAVSPPAYLFKTASATLLNLNLSGAQTVHWSVSYRDEA